MASRAATRVEPFKHLHQLLQRHHVYIPATVVGLALAAALCYAVASVLQQRAAARQPHHLARRMGLLVRLQPRVGRRLEYLAGASFGVFFVHEYVIEILRRVVLRVMHHDLPGNPVTFVLVLAGCTAVSLGVVALVRALFGAKSRYVIGC